MSSTGFGKQRGRALGRVLSGEDNSEGQRRRCCEEAGGGPGLCRCCGCRTWPKGPEIYTKFKKWRLVAITNPYCLVNVSWLPARVRIKSRKKYFIFHQFTWFSICSECHLVANACHGTFGSLTVFTTFHVVGTVLYMEERNNFEVTGSWKT